VLQALPGDALRNVPEERAYAEADRTGELMQSGGPRSRLVWSRAAVLLLLFFDLFVVIFVSACAWARSARVPATMPAATVGSTAASSPAAGGADSAVAGGASKPRVPATMPAATVGSTAASSPAAGGADSPVAGGSSKRKISWICSGTGILHEYYADATESSAQTTHPRPPRSRSCDVPGCTQVGRWRCPDCGYMKCDDHGPPIYRCWCEFSDLNWLAAAVW
jgi:hypothetical protein